MKRFLIIMLLSAAPYFSTSQNNPELVSEQADHLSEATVKDKEFVSWLEQKIDSVRQKHNIPAISLGIIKDGKTIFSGGFGLHNRNGAIKADEFSIYQIASDTKKMTGIIARNLANEGKLSLDKPILVYLENLIEKEAQKRLGNITLRQLLLHQAGLPYRQPTTTRKDGEPMLIPYTEQDLLNDLNNVELKAVPGSEFGYSNFGYAVAGYICERASGTSYAELIAKYISRAYDMPNTTITLTEALKKRLVTPYKKENRDLETKAFIMGKLEAAGGVYSTVSDLTSFMLQQLNAYETYNGAMKSNPLVLHEDPFSKEDDYGFGMGKKVFKTGTQFGHGGDMDGFASGYVFSPEYRSGVILLTSSGGRWVGEIEREIFYRLTGRSYDPSKKGKGD